MFKGDFGRSYDKSRDLCFDENEFLKESFSVDSFLREHRNTASLEVMRDDLGTHLKTLRLSMIELINKNYEDFVNLSKDLVGLDNKIQKIQIPLESIKSEVLIVKNDLEEAMIGIQNSLMHYEEISNKKRDLIHLNEVITCINKLKTILGLNNKNEINFGIEFIERATVEFNYLQFSLSKSSKSLSDSQRKDAEEINNKLMTVLNKKFLDCLKNKNVKELVQCLKIYKQLGKIQDLESFVKYQIVAPKLSEIISEKALQVEPDGISHVVNEIVSFIEKELMQLLVITTNKDIASSLKGYNFLINSIWPELEKRLSLPLMFAPGNPILFHTRFTKSIELLHKLEIFCGNYSSVLKLRENKQYQNFIQKWNLPVYFKIRFQEIAGQVEKCLDEVSIGKPIGPALEETNSYQLKSCSVVMEQIKKCWRNDIYLAELSHLFWKLSLQILSRYKIWLDEILNKEAGFFQKRKSELGALQTSYGMDNFHVRSRLDFLVCLFSDTNKLLEECKMFLEKSKEKINNRHLIENELSISLTESLHSIELVLPNITESIVKIIVSESAVHLRQISQIPRLFRRTNRKSSSEPCEYVGQILHFPNQFQEWKKNLSPQILKMWLTSVFNELANQFFTAVHEVLTNAQKTEESLRKLKKKKENYSSRDSGDEEIRLQLVTDVHSFSNGIQRFQIPKENVKILNELIELVETAKNNSEKQ